MLVAGIDMRLGPHAEDAVKVVDVDMYKDAEETGQDLGADLLEVLGKGTPRGWGGQIDTGHQQPFDETLPNPAHPPHCPGWPLSLAHFLRETEIKVLLSPVLPILMKHKAHCTSLLLKYKSSSNFPITLNTTLQPCWITDQPC